VAVGGTLVGVAVAVGGTAVAVAVGGTAVAVAVGGTGVAVAFGGTGVAVAVADVAADVLDDVTVKVAALVFTVSVFVPLGFRMAIATVYVPVLAVLGMEYEIA